MGNWHIAPGIVCCWQNAPFELNFCQITLRVTDGGGLQRSQNVTKDHGTYDAQRILGKISEDLFLRIIM